MGVCGMGVCGMGVCGINWANKKPPEGGFLFKLFVRISYVGS